MRVPREGKFDDCNVAANNRKKWKSIQEETLEMKSWVGQMIFCRAQIDRNVFVLLGYARNRIN